MTKLSVAFEWFAIAFVSVLVVWGVWSFGIWDPWELEVAEAARAVPGTGPAGSRLRHWMIVGAFDTFGTDPFTGRLPMVLAGLVTCIFTYSLVARDVGHRAAALSVVVMGTTPLFFLNARLMIGESIGFAAQAGVALAALRASSAPTSSRRRATWIGWLAVGIVTSALANGVLLGPLPPLLAVGVWSQLTRDTEDRTGRPVGRWILVAVSAALLIGVVRAVARDATTFSLWLGGGAVGGDPPTHEAAFELVFHGFAPWSVMLPVAVFWMMAPRQPRTIQTQDLGWVLILWSAFGYVTWTVFASRYGVPPYLAVVPLGGLVAIALDEILDSPESRWPAAVATTLLVGLLMRDFALYPESALRGLTVEELQVPEAVHTSATWSALLGLFGLILCLLLTTQSVVTRPVVGAAIVWAQRQWQRGPVVRGWLLIAASVLGGCLAFGLLCITVDLPISSVAVRIGQALFAVPFVVGGSILGAPWLRYGFARLGQHRIVPLLGSALLIAAYFTLQLQPALSQHYSPKALYDTYNDLATSAGEPLVTYRSTPAAARYYTSAPTREIDERSELIDYLQAVGQRWAIVGTEELPGLNHEYRRHTGRHLYVADARSARMLLVASEPIPDRANQNFIAPRVLMEPPEIEHPLSVDFGGRVALLGYELELPEEDSVGAGQSFSMTWFWKLTGKSPIGYQVFVHIDGFGQRINGDHVPIEGGYPFEHWEEGDVIVDRQTLTVPANFPAGDYEIYVGLYKGEHRMEVVSGKQDGADRVQVGTLRVR